MPKQKRASSAQCARQAKKRKRTQRQDPVKQQQEKNEVLEYFNTRVALKWVWMKEGENAMQRRIDFSV